jgi:hypothetical protein
MSQKPLDEKQLQALLRLKRYEQPPPGYFEDLLANIHQRQREELLRRPAWRIALERLRTFLTVPSMGNLAYGGAMAALLVTGVVAIRFALPGQPATNSTQYAANATPAGASVAQIKEREDSLVPLDVLPAGVRTVQPINPNATRYIMDSRPVSYEQQQIRF